MLGGVPGDDAAQHIAFEEYAQGVDEAGKRIERLEAAIGDELTRWRWRPVVAALEAFRGIRTIHAVRLCSRYRRLSARGLNRNKIIVAVARELSGFVWALGQQVKPLSSASLR